jgi:hypothetical protein
MTNKKGKQSLFIGLSIIFIIIVLVIIFKTIQAPTKIVPVPVNIPVPVTKSPYNCKAQIPGGLFGANCTKISNDIQPIYTDRYMCDVYGTDGGKLYTGPIEQAKVICN